ncbi:MULTISPECIES: cytochrome b561 domain-containing protein [Pacificibacter]|uniref:cytochrome b561 domain-containing protein n=1 Tax=Pacificibacter TaxID=1042323 RepID=UPI001C0A2DA5|nr:MULTISPECIES: cytochrome b561 domain-containing protein [Pacificibacter]MBU2937563.1 cytochrome b561 domain-containing protein [Pacificibacter marinus]MDO6616694.1 cytochrome b561 domain-containing protein [Pacificibacter sp. 1_MG-2023]
MLDWFLSPIDAARAHDIGFALSWHARLMVLSWGVITPLAILIARFYKITPKQDWPRELDNRIWWDVHFWGQISSFGIACIALVLILISAQNTGAAMRHHVLGYTVMGLGAMQLLSGALRGTKGGPTAPHADGSLRGDHFDMTPRRLAFEFIHKLVGYTALGLIMIAITTGLWAANAPIWMWVVIGGWWALLALVAVVLQWRGRAFDTYQAIWGPDASLPGNQRPKQGVCITRPSESPDYKNDYKDKV